LRSLFLKIFLWFALAMVLASIGAFVTGVFTERQFHPRRQNPFAPAFGLYAEMAVEIYERDGQAALASYLERVERASGIDAFVLNERGEEVNGRALPEGAKDLARRATLDAPFVFDPPRQPPQRPLGAQVIRSPRGALYTLVGELPRPDFPRPEPPRLGEPGALLFGLHMLGPRLLVVLLIGSVFCYWLARYLTTPVVKLRATTRELADGNLTARVQQNLIRRRDEIGYLGSDFNLMAGRIESLVLAQRRLLGDISHELRSPLSRLRVALELARRRAAPEAGRALDRIEREAESINEMIGQLLALSRFETGPDRLNNVRVDLCALVQEVADDADYEARSRNCSVRVTGCEECHMDGVAELLRSAVENVLRNAVRYTAEGTEVEISLRRETVDAAPYALVSVRDHGAGVPPEAIEEIFRPFYRVEDARDRQTGGTGLGLAIAARAVHLHGGTVKASNAADGGLVVEIRFPLKENSR
jgi:two-component system, OmpR family, sensor histidine kinase CpxA